MAEGEKPIDRQSSPRNTLKSGKYGGGEKCPPEMEREADPG